MGKNKGLKKNQFFSDNFKFSAKKPQKTQATKPTAQGNKSVAPLNKFTAQGNKNAAQGNN